MGETFGNYEILKKIAAGGMAEVFLAKHSGMAGFERLVCIKRILPHLSVQEDFIKMFFDEARIAANLVHPNIAQIYDIGQVEDAYYIAMEYVRGEDLRRVYNQEVARGRAMPTEPAAHVIMGAASALDYAHRQTSIDGRPLGIVHRDISPQNILVTYDGHVKLVDFGVAKAANKMTETRSGVLKGKYSYMSPEQASGDPIDARTDIFALGITLYEVTTGTRLFKRQSEIDTLHAVIECKVRPPSDVLPGYDPKLEAIIMRALSFDPDDRFATAAQMERELEQYLIDKGHATSAANLGAYMQDLFADKLADELLFGGQPWEENMTPNRHAGTRPHASASEKSPPRVNLERTEAIDGLERTEVEDPATRADNGWGATRGSASKTATQGHTPRHSKATPIPTEATNVRRFVPLAVIGGGIALLATVVSLVIVALPGNKDGAPRSGSVVIDSEPRGARVEILGEGVEAINQSYAGYRTVFTIREGLPIGTKLRARFLKDGYDIVEIDLPELEAGVTPDAPIFAELPASKLGEEPGSLVLMTTPEGAEVWIDGNREPGRTPLSEVRVRSGEAHRVEFRLKDHEPVFETIFVERGARRFIERTLHPKATAQPAAPTPPETTTASAEPALLRGSAEQPAVDQDSKGKAPRKDTKDKRKERRGGFITITTPGPMQASLDGKPLGTTPLRRIAVDAGSHTLRVEDAEAGIVVRRKVRIGEGQVETVEIVPKKGNLSLNANPWAWVQLGNGAREQTPWQKSLYEGSYSVTFECPDGTKKQEQALVRGGQTAALSVNCRKQ